MFSFTLERINTIHLLLFYYFKVGHEINMLLCLVFINFKYLNFNC